jgi:hypothetical protein
MTTHLFRGAIGVAVIAFLGSILVPTDRVSITLPLPQPGTPMTSADQAVVVGALAGLLLFVSCLMLAMAAIGLLGFRRWARGLARWTTPVAIGAMLATWALIPPFFHAMHPLHFVLFAIAAIAWCAALVLLRSPEVRGRFVPR